MLLQMRSLSRSWVAYVLLALLVVAFAVWGVNDVFSGVGGQNLAEVSGRKITPPQLTRELDLTLRAQRAEGANITQTEAIDAGLHRRLLDGIIAREALYAYAERIGVSASDTQVAARIREIPNVRNAVTGSFDQNAYDAFLGQLRYSRREFEEDMRGDLTTQMLMEALVSGIRAPSSYGALAFAYDAETRVVSIAEAPASAVGTIPPPNDAQLQAFWEDNQERLRIPEYRGVTLIYARPEDFMARVTVPEARIREEFEARRAALTQPERRTYVRIVAQNETQANEVAGRLGRGESAAAIAADMGLQSTRGENQAQREVPDDAVAEAVFEMQAGGAARVVRGELSPWVVVRVQSVTAAVEPSFADQREELRNLIAADEAADMLNNAISEFEDARAGGASLADAARQQRLEVVSVPAVDETGADQSGAPVEAFAEHEELLRTVFDTPEGEASDFIPAGDADVIVAVDRIIPASVRPLDEVRGELTQAWIARERARRLRELGEEVVAAVQGGQTLAQAARANRMNLVVSSQEVNRRAAQQIPARGLASQIFAAREGQVVSDMRADGGAVLVAVVETINRADPSEAPQVVEANRAQMEQSLTSSFGEAVQTEVVDRAEPRRNEELLDQIYRPSNAGAEDGQ